MSKRLCISLLHAPQRSARPLLQCRSPTNAINHSNNVHRPRRRPQHVSSQRRPFTTTSPHRAGQMSASRQIAQRRSSQPSISVSQKNQLRAAQNDGSILEYMGLLQGSFIPPTGKNLPSLLASPRARLKVEYARLQNAYKVLISHVLATRWWITPALPLQYFKTPQIGKTLYEEMSSKFASGDLSGLENKVSSGMLKSLRARVQQRPQNTYYKWRVLSYTSSPSCVQFVNVAIPKPDMKRRPNDEILGLVQAVIRIRSKQSLVRFQKKSEKDPKTGKTVTKEVALSSSGEELQPQDIEAYERVNARQTTEYVVLHRYVVKSKPGAWHIWGTAEETTYEKLLEEEKQAKQAMEGQTSKTAKA